MVYVLPGFARRTIDSCQFLEPKKRCASWASCWSWKAIWKALWNTSWFLIALCAAPFARNAFLVFRTVNETAVLKPVYRLRRQWPAGAKLSLPDKTCCQTAENYFDRKSAYLPFLGNCSVCVGIRFSFASDVQLLKKKKERTNSSYRLLYLKWLLFRTPPPVSGYG